MEIEYFIGLGLPPKDQAFFNRLKRDNQFNNRPLSSPAHITLLPPFEERNEALLIASLDKWAADQTSFSLEFKKIAVYKHLKYATLVLEPTQSEKVKKLKLSLDKWLGWPLKERRPFRPHLTLASRVPYFKLEEIKVSVRALELRLELEVEEVILFRRFLGSQWTKYHFSPFSV